MRRALTLLTLLLPAAALAGPPEVTGDRKVPEHSFVKLTAKADPKATVSWEVWPPLPAGVGRFEQHGPSVYLAAPVGSYTLRVTVIDWDRRTLDTGAEAVTIGAATPGPPPGPAPGPGPDPPPGPLASFRVVLVYESGDSLTAAQRAVLYGRAVEDWLTANCTGGAAGWRRRDKDAPGELDPAFAPLWAAVKPKITTTPCLVIAQNDRVTIEPPPATPEAAVALLAKYKEGRR